MLHDESNCDVTRCTIKLPQKAVMNKINKIMKKMCNLNKCAYMSL